MKTQDLLATLLRNDGYAIFENHGDDSFRAIGGLPAYFKHLPGLRGSKGGRLRLAERFPFVANFLIDARKAWGSKSGRPVTSGLWIERGTDGRDIPLECSAFCFFGKKIMIVRSPQAHFEESRHLLQTGRESRLQYESFLREMQKKEILLHCIIHDLSQPLTAMRACFSSLGLARLPRGLKGLVEIGERQSQQQESMIREVMDAFASDLSAQQKPSGEVVTPPDLVACATAVVRDFSAAFAEKEVRLELDKSIDLSRAWHVVGDESRLRRVYCNFVENALRHSPPGSVVTVGIADEGRYLRAFVDDGGPGLPKGEPAAHLFRLLSKGKNLGGKGGIGLYFCKITVERWGGTVGCESRPEGGARFWFRIPRHDPKKTEGDGPVPSTAARPPGAQGSGLPEPLNQPVSSHGPSLRILVAEDTAVIRQLATRMLRERGHKVIAARNGVETLKRIRRQAFDVVVMDVDMPDLNGLDATRAIRREEKETGRHFHVIGMSAFGSTADRRRCLSAGMDSILPKPFRAEELCAAVESCAIRSEDSVTILNTAPNSSEARREDLLERFKGKTKLLVSLIRIFLQDCPKKLSEIRRALARGDGALLATTAHALRGQIGVFFGGDDAVLITRKLEKMGRDGDLADAPEAFADLLRRTEVLSEELRALAVNKGARRGRRSRQAGPHGNGRA